MRTFTAIAFAALATVSLAATPASAGPHWHPYHNGYWGGPGLVFGLAGAAIAAGFAANAYCVRYEPMYDNWGNYLGRRAVNVC